MDRTTFLRLGGATLILANAAHKLLYPAITVMYTWEPLMAALPVDPVLYVYGVQAISVVAALLLAAGVYPEVAASVLAGTVTFVAINLTLGGWVDMALREAALALLFYAYLFHEEGEGPA